MLTEIHDVLRTVIYSGAGFSSDEVDIYFEPPTREWIDRLTRPSIVMVPIDLYENLELGRKDFQVRRAERIQETAFPARRIDVRYLTTALSSEPADEHELVWRCLAALLRTPELPSHLLPPTVQALNTPVVVTTALAAEELRLLDVWSNLGVEPHPAFSCVVTLPLDPELMTRAPLVLTRTTRYGRRDLEPTRREERSHIGGVVRDQHGQPLAGAVLSVDGAAEGGTVADAAGRFILRSLSSGSHALQVESADGRSGARLDVPGTSYEITSEITSK